MRPFAICLVFVSQLTLPSVSQQAVSDQSAAVSCPFDDGKQMKVQHDKSPAKGEEELHRGELWQAGGSPMMLFTQTFVTLGSSVVPEGAYSLYDIPEKRDWTFVVTGTLLPVVSTTRSKTFA